MRNVRGLAPSRRSAEARGEEANVAGDNRDKQVQILQTLAQMLEAPRWEKITTAALAARLDVSEAALYRHFAARRRCSRV